MEKKLSIHDEGGLRKTQNSRLVGIEKGFNLGITILFGHRMTMTQFDDEEVATLVEYLMDQYPQLFTLPEPPPEVQEVQEKLDGKNQLVEASVDRMHELKTVIRHLVEAIEAVERLGEAQTKPPATMVDKVKKQVSTALAEGKEALD